MKKVILIFNLFLCLFLAKISNAQFPTEGLVAAYLFNGNTNDASSNHYNASVFDGTYTSDRFNTPNSAVYFNGLYPGGTKFITPSINQPLEKFTISFWFNMDNPQWLNNYTHRLITIGALEVQLCLPEDSIVGNPLRLNNQNFSTTPIDFLNYNFVPSTWYHVVYVYDNSNLYLYINEKLMQITNVTGNVANNYGILLGGINGKYYKGKIDDVLIYNRVLSYNEIRTISIGFKNLPYFENFNSSSIPTGWRVNFFENYYPVIYLSNYCYAGGDGNELTMNWPYGQGGNYNDTMRMITPVFNTNNAQSIELSFKYHLRDVNNLSGTNIKLQSSYDGIHWRDENFNINSIGTSIGPDSVRLIINNNNADNIVFAFKFSGQLDNYDYLLIDDFKLKELFSYSIVANAFPLNSGTISGAGIYIQGQTVSLTAKPANGYTFTNWTEYGNQISTDTTYSFTTSENRTLIANFTLNSYTISANALPSNSGTITGVGSYNFGQTVSLSAKPAKGYTFVNWTENGNQISTDTTYSFTTSGNRTLIANFTLNSYTISANALPSNSGTITGVGLYNYGQTVTLSANANNGYTFEYWKENDSIVSNNASITFTAENNRYIIAHFTLNTHVNSSISKDNNLLVYPNPAKDFIKINLPNINENSILTITDVGGKIILKNNINIDDVKINVNQFKNGIYYLNISNNSGLYQSKFIINR